MLKLLDKDFKSAILNMVDELKEMIFKELKKIMRKMSLNREYQ